ncbi:NAD(P)/FAD-dependent oxidoreductase [Phytomonospora endophytica]|uniref:Assimilatory nitrate reductase electron transfer subunit n=1 Tax=Phytomonospora endophytica TaxID=714109 RepID=A0A841FPU9_9ACTN|nr:FAD-dependent oxidoreductase [Phytomonospora endophytica]MBB6033980.1 assimilatory nitrate reductase electron transfer subunit [Phytomonospora endophytica]GIG64499.1 FAD/NAD(P)-binding oxidoreductase [Phytomonospora endophytica]
MKVVIAGYGMAGARLAELLAARDAGVEVTVIGAEARPAANRVLLSRLLTGELTETDLSLHEPGWAPRSGVDLRTGTSVSHVDRDGRHVLLSDGTHVPYDALVLATGSRPVLPPIEGLAPDAPGVTVLRTVDDFLGAAAVLDAEARAVVLGGGVLGLETAFALSRRATSVTVVQPSGRLMDRQLDAGAAAILNGLCRRHGLCTVLGRGAVRLYPGEGVKLDDGSFLPAELTVVAAGVRPDTRLAECAGLAVDGGVLVDDRLRTTDPAIHAIGDCARATVPPQGLVAPAWRQAEVLADVLTGGDARYHHSPAPTRLRAGNIDLTVVGDGRAETGEVLRFEDPAGGRYARLAVDGDRLSGAILLGLDDAAARITQLHDGREPLPADRIALMFGRSLPAGPAGADALVCRCNGVTEKSLVDAWRAGAADAAALTAATRAGTGCGDCAGRVAALTATLNRGDTP